MSGSSRISPRHREHYRQPCMLPACIVIRTRHSLFLGISRKKGNSVKSWREIFHQNRERKRHDQGRDIPVNSRFSQNTAVPKCTWIYTSDLPVLLVGVIILIMIIIIEKLRFNNIAFSNPGTFSELRRLLTGYQAP